MNNKKIKLIISIIIALCILITVAITYKETGKIDKNEINKAVDIVINTINTYNMEDEEIQELPSTEIQVQTEEQEKITGETQATTETEGFEEQGEIAYNGTSEYPDVVLGNYIGLTYYSQIDNRWKDNSYTSTGNTTQTIGSSGCGPTSAAMVVTAIKGTITPPEMADLFVRYGYRSANNGTYFSAYRWLADTFDIGYEETYYMQTAIQLLENENLLIVSCGNGLFTTGGHFIVIVGIEGDMLKIYDPYLYAGKFDTATRRGKVSVEGNTVYCSIDNFKNYANYKKFFAFKKEGTTNVNDTKPVTTATYIRYVTVNSRLNVRNIPMGNIIDKLNNGTQVTVYETQGEWSRIGDNRWVNSNYLTNVNNQTTNYISTTETANKTYSRGTYKVLTNIHVRSGASTKYSDKTYKQLTSNARQQNRKLGGEYNGYRKGVVCTVTKISGNWGLTASGWICLDYCEKI